MSWIRRGRTAKDEGGQSGHLLVLVNTCYDVGQARYSQWQSRTAPSDRRHRATGTRPEPSSIRETNGAAKSRKLMLANASTRPANGQTEHEQGRPAGRRTSAGRSVGRSVGDDEVRKYLVHLSRPSYPVCMATFFGAFLMRPNKSRCRRCASCLVSIIPMQTETPEQERVGLHH